MKAAIGAKSPVEQRLRTPNILTPARVLFLPLPRRHQVEFLIRVGFLGPTLHPPCRSGPNRGNCMGISLDVSRFKIQMPARIFLSVVLLAIPLRAQVGRFFIREPLAFGPIDLSHGSRPSLPVKAKRVEFVAPPSLLKEVNQLTIQAGKPVTAEWVSLGVKH